MTAAVLRDALVSAGLTVREDRGWATRGTAWARGKPVGVMHHHTTEPVPYPISRLNGSGDGLIKCNMNTKPDGTVWLVAYRATNFSSGSGSSVVLAETTNRIAPSGSALSRGLTDNVNGNPLYWNFENDHPGDGSPIPRVQWNAIVRATAVVNQHFGLVPNQTIAHAEWTRRKVDPRWDRNTAHTNLNVIRLALEEEKPTMSAMRLPLRLGDVGEDVRYLQTKLIILGFLPRTNPPAPPANHGTYDDATAAAVLAMRKSQGSGATHGNVYNADAAQQLDSAWSIRYAQVFGKPGPVGPPGPPGKDGKDGKPATLTITGDVNLP